MNLRTLSPAFALLFATALPAQSPVSLPPDLDSYVTRVMSEFKVPGVALAVVKDGKVLAARGYGVRELGKPTPVDAVTRFGIASNTKAFTATALGILVEEGKLAWDAPVIRYLPSFAMYDPYVTRELTIRDLLVHRSGLGLGAGDLLWWPPSTYDRKEIARRLRFIKPATSFRTAYAYDNVLYLIAGEVIETISGQTWEDFVSSRILAKVGMTNSNVRHSDAGAAGNDAFPHAEVEGRVRRVAPFASDNTNPAGGINAGATDMAKWMIVQLDSGRLSDGSRLFSQSTARELWTLVTPIAPGTPAPGLGFLRSSFVGYGLGFFVSDYRGRKLLSHTGGLPGYLSKVVMLPDQKTGVAVLTNQESGYAFNAITNRLLDHFLGAAPVDYPAIYKRLESGGNDRIAAADRAAAARRDSLSRPSLPLAGYAGTYTDPWYGDVIIGQQSGKLFIRFAHTPSLVGDLVHWQHDTFVARWRDRELRADAFVTFALNPDASIDQIKMQAVSESVDFSFDFHDLLLKPKPR
ncbi:MAG TPA: serine hydrolase [Gemmatimonadaceae bacterium]|nr:serine hydrolase [Gemmatimonadaceae bacterium]